MKLSAKDQTAIIQLLARFCDEIYAIEGEFHLYFNQADMRPRIDYFHDAIRAFMAERPNKEQQRRLHVENLAYDIQAMRYLTEKPLANLSGHAAQSPKTAIVAVEPALLAQSKKPDRAVKEQISELYKQYAMLFAALLKPTADVDYHERTEQMDEEVGNIKAIIDALRKGGAAEIETLINHLENATLQDALIKFAGKSKGKQNAELPELLGKLKLTVQALDKNIKTIDTAHHLYATTQLTIYENAKDNLKKMMTSGLNLVGAFVEASIHNNTQGRNR